MKILFHRSKLYSPLHTNTNGEEGQTEGREKEAAQTDSGQEKGRVLSLIIVIGMLICCLAWTLTIWFYCGGAKFQNEKIEFQSLQCSSMPDEYRFDCYPKDGVDQSKCEARGCCWNPPADVEDELRIATPFCYYPTGYQSYILSNSTKFKSGKTLFYKRILESGYPGDVDVIRVDVSFHEKERIRVKISDAENARFEVPYLPEMGERQTALEEDEQDYRVIVQGPGFGIRIVRKTNNQILFETTGGLVFSNQFLQISTLLPSHFIYGLGENRSPLLKSTQWKQHTLWSADQWPALGSTNLYGSHPFYLSMDEGANAHGIFLKNSNAMEIVLQPTPAITFRALGGILDFYIFTGPTPNAVVEQYTDVIGKPFIPPYWALGYQQCKFGYKSLERTKQILEQTQKAGIPIDVQWNDIDYMNENKDFTVDSTLYKGLGQFVEDLHKNGMHYIPIIDPGISGSEAAGTYPPFDLGNEMGIFIRNSTNQPFVGKVWNRQSTVWPDFTHPNATKYWTQMIADFHKEVPIDGAWIDMNEPSNFLDGQADGCPKTGIEGLLNNPPYVPKTIQGGTLYYHTVCPSARQSAGSHYDLHNMYGFTEIIATSHALKEIRNARPFIVSRSSFPGHGHYGAHWTGDVLSDWGSMKQSITDILNFNMFGIPMVGADICGFNGNTTAALCNRWMQLGAFYPFSRNHNTDNGIDQDPVSLGPEVVKSSKNALLLRYSLLPYLYSLMVRSHLHGTPVARPTFFEFPQDQNTYFMDQQFMWGEALLILPVLEEGATTVTGYLPEGVWYTLDNQTRIESSGDFFDFDAPLDKIPLLARGGTIIPKQQGESTTTTTKSRQNPFTLSVFLDKWGKASGQLFLDDGDSLQTYELGAFTHVNFNARDAFRQKKGKKLGHFKTSIVHNGYKVPQTISKVEILGVENVDEITSVTYNDKTVQFSVDAILQILVVQNLNADLTKPVEIFWN